MKVKICGLTSLEDALAACEAGADLLGFNFYSASPRYILPVHCSRLVEGLRQRGCTALLVGVFVNSNASQVSAILDECHLDLAQLSGDESPRTLAQLGERAFKALRPTDRLELEASLQRFPPRSQAPAWLIDAYRPGAYGGTGQLACWDLAASLAARAPILLAGGLNPDNVAEAVSQVWPWGVDVASGVESSPGKKDAAKIAAFIKTAKQEESQ